MPNSIICINLYKSRLKIVAMQKQFIDIGLEIHAQVISNTKLFSRSPSSNDKSLPNSCICPFDLSHPGVMPQINKFCITQGVKAAIALNCHLQQKTFFDRKHYFYPDLPQGYQISQFYKPLGMNGKLEYKVGDTNKIARIKEIHLEQDAGRSIHDIDQHNSLLDFNRAGSPLVEIVTEPDFHCADDVIAFLKELRLILIHCSISTACLEAGAMRCDVSISVRKSADEPYGTRCEIKNLNSLTAIKSAIEYEANLRWDALIEGKPFTIEQTKMFDSTAQKTVVMRKKESPKDYAYLPDIDIPPIYISNSFVDLVAKSLPTMPIQKRKELEESGVDSASIEILLSEKPIFDFFEQCCKSCSSTKAIANWIINELIGRMNKISMDFKNLKVQPSHIATIIESVNSNKITGKVAKAVLDECFETGEDPNSIIKRSYSRPMIDGDALNLIVREVINENPNIISKIIESSNEKSAEFLIGMTMRKANGAAQPNQIRQKIKDIIEEMKQNI